MNITMALRITRQEQGNPRQDEIAVAVSANVDTSEGRGRLIKALEEASDALRGVTSSVSAAQERDEALAGEPVQ